MKWIVLTWGGDYELEFTSKREAWTWCQKALNEDACPEVFEQDQYGRRKYVWSWRQA